MSGCYHHHSDDGEALGWGKVEATGSTFSLDFSRIKVNDLYLALNIFICLVDMAKIMA